MIVVGSRKNMNGIRIEQLDISDTEAVRQCSDLIMEVMIQFNKEEITSLDIWFASVEGFITRNELHKDIFSSVQFIAKYKEKIIGVLEIAEKKHIQLFFVKKGFQNKGVGKKLLDFSIKFFINNGIEVKKYTVHSSKYAVSIYRKLGFVQDERYLYLNVENKILDNLAKTLA